jgi:hypothetical protein
MLCDCGEGYIVEYNIHFSLRFLHASPRKSICSAVSNALLQFFLAW